MGMCRPTPSAAFTGGTRRASRPSWRGVRATRVLCTISPSVRSRIDLFLPCQFLSSMHNNTLHFIIYLSYTLLTQNAKPRTRRILYFDILITEASNFYSSYRKQIQKLSLCTD